MRERERGERKGERRKREKGRERKREKGKRRRGRNEITKREKYQLNAYYICIYIYIYI